MPTLDGVARAGEVTRENGRVAEVATVEPPYEIDTTAEPVEAENQDAGADREQEPTPDELVVQETVEEPALVVTDREATYTATRVRPLASAVAYTTLTSGESA